MADMDTLLRLQKKPHWPTEDLPRAEDLVKQTYYGWFSQKQKNMTAMQKHTENYGRPSRPHHKSHIYKNAEGEEIEVTAVGVEALPPIYYDDIEYRGIMVQWVRNVY